MAKEGEDIREHLTKKYGPRAVANFGDPNGHLYVAGRKVGIEFTSERNIYPTIKAHALMEHVKKTDNEKANKIMEEMYKRYFERGENINSIDVLTDIATKLEVAASEAKECMESKELQQQVREKDQHHKTRMNIHGVPFYIIERTKGGPPIGFSGAYPPEIIAEQLEEAAAAEE